MQKKALGFSIDKRAGYSPKFNPSLVILLARVVKSVDTRDLKSLDLTVVPVQVRPRAPKAPTPQNLSNFGLFCHPFRCV